MNGEVPLIAHLDVWLALGGTPIDFDAWMADPKRTPADAWAQLLAAIRGDDMSGDTNPAPGLILDLVTTANTSPSKETNK